jgi:signal transduction histidine kinase
MNRRLGLRWKDWPLAFKGGAVIASSLLMLLASLATSYRLERQTADATAEMLRTLKVQGDIQTLHTLIAEAATGVRGFLLTGRDDFLAPYRSAEAQLPATIADLQENVRDPAQLERLQRALPLVQKKLESLDALRDSRGAAADDLHEHLWASKQILDQLRDEIRVLSAHESQLVEQRTAALQSALRRNLLMNAATILIGIIGATAMLTFMLRVVYRVRLAADNAERLTLGLQLESSDTAADELGQLASRMHAAGLLLAERATAAQAASRAKTEFLSRTSHELRTPLNAILGFAQLLEDDLTDSHAKQSATQIVRAGQHLLALINEVLDIGRIEAGKLPIESAPVEVAPMLAETLAFVTPLATQRGIRLEQAACCDGLAVLADRQRLIQVVLNLLSNAIKYASLHGRVQVCAVEREDSVAIVIEDDGPGIPAELMERLFTPFDRLGAERGKTEGAGLGLAVSKSLMQAMGGDIVVSSTHGRGSVFTLKLPRSELHMPTSVPSPMAPSNISAPESSITHTVLCIEDDASHLALIETLIERRPHWRLLAARTGQEGLQLARKRLPDMLLLSLELPDLTGAAVLRAIRDDDALVNLPVVILSANTSSAPIAQLHGLGVAGYLNKPLDLTEFFEILNRTIR